MNHYKMGVLTPESLKCNKNVIKRQSILTFANAHDTLSEEYK